MSRTLVAFVTHFLSGAVRDNLDRLRRDLRGMHDVVVLLSMNEPAAAGGDVVSYRPGVDSRPEFPRRMALDAHNVDLLLLHVARRLQNYDYYLAVEYDVRFSGNWRILMEAFEHCDADLLGTTLCGFEAHTDWSHWTTLEGPARVPMTQRLRGFFPIYRLSRSAIDAVSAAYRDGWGGHYELTIPTLVRRAGGRIEDLGGTGPFVAPGNRDRFYANSIGINGLAPGSFVYRPIRDAPGDKPRTLYHPVRALDTPSWGCRG